MVDGAELRIAHMGWEKNEIAIYSLETYSLPVRLGKLRTATASQPAALGAEEGDIFGLEERELEEDLPASSDNGENEDLSSTLINIFAKYPLKKAKIAVNIPEGQATYYNFESDFGLKGKKLKKRLGEEIAPLTGGTLESAIIDHFVLESRALMAVVAEGNVPLIEELIDIKNFLAGGTPYFCRTDPNEIALVNLVRLSLDPPAKQITAVVYIGNDFSRVIVMRGSEPISFIQSIREGYSSPQVCQTLFSKILLEQEEAGIPEIDQIVLAGEIGMTRAFEFFKKQFPDADVKPITPGPLDTSLLKNEEIAIFANYAIPVAMAWQALDSKNSRWIRSDLMPHSIKESQKAFKIAWHGFLLLGVIFLLMMLLSYQGLNRLNKIHSLQESIRLKQSSIAALEADLGYINQIQQQISQIKGNLDFLDALVIDPDKWSRLFAKLSEDFKNVDRIWIDHIQSTPFGFTMVGKALSRDRVPLLAAGFQGVNLKRVTRVISENGDVAYEFELDAEIPPPPEPEAADQEPAGTDRAVSSGGKIEAPEEIAQETNAPNLDEASVEMSTANREAFSQQKEKAVGPDLTDAKKATIKTESKPPSEPMPQRLEKAAEPREQLAAVPTKRVEKTVSNTPAPPTNTYQETYQKGIELIRKREVKKALSEFQTLLEMNPGPSEAAAAYYWVGECQYALGDYQEAAAAFENSLGSKDNPKRQAGMLMLGMSYLKLGQKEKAGQQFQAIIEAYPNGAYTDTAKRKLEELAG